MLVYNNSKKRQNVVIVIYSVDKWVLEYYLMLCKNLTRMGMVQTI